MSLSQTQRTTVVSGWEENKLLIIVLMPMSECEAKKYSVSATESPGGEQVYCGYIVADFFVL